MEMIRNYPLKSLNTFGIGVDGKYFCRVASIGEIREALQFAGQNNLPVLVLGGGSNVLFRDNFEGVILHVNFQGIEIIGETTDHVYVKAGAGENWDDFVKHCVENHWAGIENLSLIPGRVGASPIQNIGAYGVEMKDFFHELEYIHFEENKKMIFKPGDCNFAYRDSIFKRQFKGKGIILNVTFRLDKNPEFMTDYGSIREELEKMKVQRLNLQNLRQAVIRIRQNKLPDPAVIGNAGSFFKNPEISITRHNELMAKFPNLVSFALDNGNFKLAAGWLIDQCGWKGYREGDAGVHSNQALVLVNHGNASGRDVLELSEKIRKSVFEKFGIDLEREVNIV